MADWGEIWELKGKSLFKLHQAGKLLIILDGFDEAELVGDSLVRKEHFTKLWEFNLPDSKIIITGRPNYFLNNHELESLLRTHKKYNKSHAYCEEIHLERFNISQIGLALRNVESSTCNEIISLLRNIGTNSSFFDLMSRPSHLFLTSLIWERELAKYKSNINSARVYQCFLRDAYARQYAKGNNAEQLTIFERSYFIQGVALEAAKISQFTNTFDVSFIKRVVKSLYPTFPDSITQEDELVNAPLKRIPLKERFKDSNNPEETIFTDIRTCGILVRDLSTFNTFRFAHKSFMEYLVSNFYQFECLNEKGTDLDIHNALKKNLELTKEDIPITPEIFKFALEIIILRIGDKMIDLSQTPESKAKILFENLYTYRQINKNLFVALLFRPFTRLKNSFKKVYLIFILSLFIGTYFFYQSDKSLVLPLVVMFLTVLNINAVFLIYSKKIILDDDNLLLWFCCCKEIGISNRDLHKLIGYKKTDLLEEEYKKIMAPNTQNETMNILSFSEEIIRETVGKLFESMFKFF